MEGALLECPRAWERLLPPGIRRAETAAELEGRGWDLLALTAGGCAAMAERKVRCRILLEPVLCIQRQLPRPDGGQVEPQEFLLPVLPGPAEVLLPLLGVRLLQIPLDRDPFAW